jgi:hypothetical protein
VDDLHLFGVIQRCDEKIRRETWEAWNSSPDQPTPKAKVVSKKYNYEESAVNLKAHSCSLKESGVTDKLGIVPNL